MQAGPHFPPELPELLDFLRPDENLYAFLGRIKREQVRTGLPWIDSLVTLRPGHVLEISGPAGSAKTELLIHLALHTLLAHDARKHVVLLDLDGKFDPLRLISVLDARLGGALRSSQGPQLARDACLARFHLLRAHSSHDFLAALCRLDALLQALQPAGGCSLVLVDNIGAFYWQDRASRAWAQTAGPAPSAADMALLAPPMTLQKVTEAVAGRLAALAALHRFVVVATKHVTQVC